MRKHVKADEHVRAPGGGGGRGARAVQSEGQQYKVELIEDLVRDQRRRDRLALHQRHFTDLCRGPHVQSTKRIKAFKLTSVAGAYWRGDSTARCSARLRHGVPVQGRLDAHLEQLEEATSATTASSAGSWTCSSSEISPGSPFWLPDGAQIWTQLDDSAARERPPRLRRGAHADLDESTCGSSRATGTTTRQHVLHRGREPADGPQAHELPGPHPDLQVRPALLPRPAAPLRRGRPVHRNELRGTLHGLMRVRHFTQDDAHIFCTEEQIQDEVRRAWRSASHLRRVRPRAAAGAVDAAREARGHRRSGTAPRPRCEAALEREGLAFEVNEGDGAFYGPKIDLHINDSLGRSWQLGTVQLDYSMPERFDLTYTGADNEDHQPVMIHRALMGSFERFIGILIEHYAGEFPLWLAPVQALVLPIADRHDDYARRSRGSSRDAGVRVEVDDRGESVGRKIRDGELRKVPYLLVVGDQEADRARWPCAATARATSAPRRWRRSPSGSGRRWRTAARASAPGLWRGSGSVSLWRPMRGFAATLLALLCTCVPAHAASQWSAPEGVAPAGNRDPVTAVDADGTAAVAFVGSTLSVSTRAPGGRFTTPVALIGSVDSPVGQFGPQGPMVALGNGHLLVAGSVLDQHGGYTAVFVRGPSGRFDAAEILRSGVAQVAAGADGTLALVSRNGAGWAVRVRRPGDAAFGAPQVVPSTEQVEHSSPPHLLVDDRGGIALYWATRTGAPGLEYAERPAGAAGFTHHELDGFAEYPVSTLATSPAGSVAFLAHRGRSITRDQSIELVLRRAGQAGFPLDQRLTLPGDAFWTGLAVNDDGAVVVAGTNRDGTGGPRTIARAADGTVTETSAPQAPSVSPQSLAAGIDAGGDATLAWRSGPPLVWGVHDRDQLFTASVPSGATEQSAATPRAPAAADDAKMDVARDGTALLAWEQFPPSGRFGSTPCVRAAVRGPHESGSLATECPDAPAPVRYPGFVQPPAIKNATGPPVMRLGGAVRQTLSRPQVSITARCAAPCRFVATGSVAVGKTARAYKLRPVKTRMLPARRRATLRLKLSRRDYRSVRRALRRGGKALARIKVTAIDRQGRRRASARKLRLRYPR